MGDKILVEPKSKKVQIFPLSFLMLEVARTLLSVPEVSHSSMSLKVLRT